MDLSRTVCEINDDFSRKSQNFTPLLKEFPLGFGISAENQKTSDGSTTGPRKKFDNIFSHVNRIHQHDKRKDVQTD